jgi:indolepyruvate ferredoxin oxidoreductase alpha subunit
MIDKILEESGLEKVLLLGNEAVARGAVEAGVRVASAYPGTPSTEVMESLVKQSDCYCEWAPNEKVAMEVAVGASVAGARSIVMMKHVGLNVAADPLFTAAYTGVNAGLVIVVADDPGMHSSQNEQDSRFYARSAHIPLLEPADSAECLTFTKLAFEISEKYDTPVIIRLVTRIAHSRSVVTPGEIEAPELKEYAKNVSKYVMMPAMARARHLVVEAREKALAADETLAYLSPVKSGDAKIGIVTSGAPYQYAREAFPDASILKLGLVYPLPLDAVRTFATTVDELVVIEDLEPFIEDALRAAGFVCHGKELTGLQGELFKNKILESVAGQDAAGPVETQGIPVRPPVLCPGCPHRAVFFALKKLGLTVASDIGCYSLGANAPLAGIDTVLCMGASVGMALGMEKARGEAFAQKTVAVIGDSTFIHSGITPLIDAVYSKARTTVIILDNSITGMTGHQHNPATGFDVRGNPAPSLSLEKLCEAVGASVRVVDPHDQQGFTQAVKDALAEQCVSVVIARRPCVLITRERKPSAFVQSEVCRKCGVCLRLGCPAIQKAEDGTVAIDASLCVGCGLCVNVCPFAAIKEGAHVL